LAWLAFIRKAFSQANQLPRKLGTFKGALAHGLNSKEIILLSGNKIRIDNFYYNAESQDANWIVSNSSKVISEYPKPALIDSEYFIIEKEDERKIGAYKGEEKIIETEKNFNHYQFLALCDVKNNTVFGYIPLKITETTISFPRKLSNFQGLKAHGLSSREVVVENEHKIIIHEFYYDNELPDIYWVLTNSDNIGTLNPQPALHNAEFVKIQREGVKPYLGETRYLISKEKDSFIKYKYLALYCIKYKRIFGYIELEILKNSNEMGLQPSLLFLFFSLLPSIINF
jgi:hypothetical protein